jgi:hypothetical protein
MEEYWTRRVLCGRNPKCAAIAAAVIAAKTKGFAALRRERQTAGYGPLRVKASIPSLVIAPAGGATPCAAGP